jgi:hypothetical protein
MRNNCAQASSRCLTGCFSGKAAGETVALGCSPEVCWDREAGARDDCVPVQGRLRWRRRSCSQLLLFRLQRFPRQWVGLQQPPELVPCLISQACW